MQDNSRSQDDDNKILKIVVVQDEWYEKQNIEDWLTLKWEWWLAFIEIPIQMKG